MAVSGAEARVDPDAVDRRLAAILSADAVGYGGLMARDDVATLRTLTAYREQITVLVRQHRGRLVDAPGDNLLAEFPSALEATRCALEIQRVLAARNAGLPAERRMAFRVGVHLGDVLVEGDRIYGDGVNLAARLQALAEPGGVSISGAVHEQVRDKLPVGVEDLGDQPIKNSPHPVRVYRLPVASDGLARPEGLPGLAGRTDVAVLVIPAAWAAYVAIVFEILFMISPFALHYYAAYGPSLNVLHRWRGTAWLTDFFLPHFSQTGSPWLDGLHGAAAILIVTGAVVFGVAFLQVYGAKLGSRGPVTGGLYGVIRHPQYLGLAVLGLGTLLLWPRVLVLIAYLTMLFLYGALARREEARCLARFGEAYRRYAERTGRFLPGRLGAGWPRLLPAAGRPRLVAALALQTATLVAGVGLAYTLRDYSLARVSALYTEEAAVLSPARLAPVELRAALEVARADDRVRQVLEAPGAGPAGSSSSTSFRSAGRCPTSRSTERRPAVTGVTPTPPTSSGGATGCCSPGPGPTTRRAPDRRSCERPTAASRSWWRP